MARLNLILELFYPGVLNLFRECKNFPELRISLRLTMGSQDGPDRSRDGRDVQASGQAREECGGDRN
jgi:hypothetical protein